MTLLAAGLAAVAVLLWRPPSRVLSRYRLGRSVVTGRPGVWLATLTALVLAPVLLGLPGPRIVLALTAVGICLFAAWLVRSSRRQTLARRRRAEVADLLGLLSAELRAGLLPARSLAGLAGDFSFLGPAARAAASGGDVAAALRDAGCVRGREALGQVAAGWQVADRAGAPLATVLGRVECAVRQEREVDQEVQSGVAPARATGRLMAVLPVVGLALGSGLGGDPVAVLIDTWVGATCCAVGCLLACAGVAWIEHIAASAEREP